MHSMVKRQKKHKAPFVPAKRVHHFGTLLSDAEQHIVDVFIEKYKIKNKSKWVRETIFQAIHKKMEDDYPTLFDEHDMRR